MPADAASASPLQSEQSRSTAISIDRLSCRFGRTLALDSVSLTVDAGSVVGLLGVNGAGKTTLIDSVCGLLRPTSGRVTVLGFDVGDAPLAVRRVIGVVPQEVGLYDELTTNENLRYAAALYGVADAGSRVSELLELVGLSPRARDRAGHLSGGMRRRLAIARALVHRPHVLLLDEPTLGVDIEARHDIWRHLRALRGMGTTILLATNYLDEATALCDRVVVLDHGRCIADGSPDALVARTGSRVELNCHRDDVTRVAALLRERDGVLEVEQMDATLFVRIAPNTNPEEIVHLAASMTTLSSFRTLGPDLVDAVRALTAT